MPPNPWLSGAYIDPGTDAAHSAFHKSEKVPGTAANDPRPIPNLFGGRDQWQSLRAASTGATVPHDHAAGVARTTNAGASMATRWAAHRVKLADLARSMIATGRTHLAAGVRLITHAGSSMATHSRTCATAQRAASTAATAPRRRSDGAACTLHAGANMATPWQPWRRGASTRRHARSMVAAADHAPGACASVITRPTSENRNDAACQVPTRSPNGKRSSLSTAAAVPTAATKPTRGITSCP